MPTPLTLLAIPLFSFSRPLLLSSMGHWLPHLLPCSSPPPSLAPIPEPMDAPEAGSVRQQGQRLPNGSLQRASGRSHVCAGCMRASRQSVAGRWPPLTLDACTSHSPQRATASHNRERERGGPASSQPAQQRQSNGLWAGRKGACKKVAPGPTARFQKAFAPC